MLRAILCTLLVACVGCVHRKDQDEPPRPLLVAAATVLDHITNNAQTAIPDSVLNATKCLIVIPSISHASQEITISGVTSCRRGSDWQAPVTVSFRASVGRQMPGALAVLVMSDRSVAALKGGSLVIGKSRKPAPLANTTPIVTQFDVASDYFAYQASDSGVLSSAEADGRIRPQHAWPERLESDKKKPSGAGANYETALRSFMNTIMPTGIVIHHTAVLASEKVPSSEQEIDEYHRERGFEIYCSGEVYHVAYHFLILPDGSVKKGRPERCEGAHAKGYNSYLGISLFGDFSSRDNPTGAKRPARPTEKQMQALVELCRRVRDQYHIPLQHIVRHSDIASTDCPGDRFPFTELLRQLAVESGRRRASQQ